MSHFLVITEGSSYEGSTIHGIHDSFVEARDETERRTADDNARQYRSEYIDSAVIQEWEAATEVRTWTRHWHNPALWEERKW